LIGSYKIITFCGSTKFKDEFLEAQKRLTLEGNIVISVGLFGHSGDNEVWTEDTKEMLDDMHKRKIDLAGEIYVINKNGYIGSSTKSEIEYANKTGKKVNYMYINCEQDCYFARGKCINKNVLFHKNVIQNNDFPSCEYYFEENA
jgi:hypothetical protein